MRQQATKSERADARVFTITVNGKPVGTITTNDYNEAGQISENAVRAFFHQQGIPTNQG